MKYFIPYIKFHRKSVIMLGLWMAVFLVVFFLSKLPAEAVGYGFLLCIVPTIILAGIDFFKYRDHCRKLEMAKEYLEVSLDRMPEAETYEEEVYQELLQELFRQKNALRSEYDNKYSEMMNYYTMWMHQIKTPISASKLLLQSEKIVDKEEMKDQLFRIEEYVGMALQYIRMDHMGADLKIQRYSLDDIVRQGIRKYAKSFIHKKIAMEYTELNYQVLTDEKWLLFVIEQLLSNAIKYTRLGKISIYMDPERPDTLVIEDTGIGIAAEDLPRIFEKGFTGYNGRTDKKSTGLGLYLCKNVMRNLNHSIWIESEESLGTRVMCGLESAKLEVD